MALDPELIMAWETPGVMTNKAYIYFNGHTVRIVFAEQGSPELPPVVRTAVVMNPVDAIELAKSIRTLLAGFEDAMKAAAGKSQQPS